MAAVIEQAPSWFDPELVIPKFSDKHLYCDAIRAGAVALQREVYVHFDRYRPPVSLSDLLLARDTANREYDRLRACGIEVPEIDWYPRQLPEGSNGQGDTLQLIARVPVIEGKGIAYTDPLWGECNERFRPYRDSTQMGELMLTDLAPRQLVYGRPIENATHADNRPYMVDPDLRLATKEG